MTTAPTTTLWKADLAHSRLTFSIRNFLGSVSGRFALSDVRVTSDDELSDVAVEAVADAASIDTGEPQRDGHLRSEEILDTATYPQITFVSKRFERDAGGESGRLVGDLTVRDVTREITVDVESRGRAVFPLNGSEAIVVTGETKIDRTDFGVSFNMPWDNRVLLGDTLDVRLEVMLLRQDEADGDA